MLTLARFYQFFKVFEDVNVYSPAIVSAWLQYAFTNTSAQKFGANHELAMALLAAHMIEYGRQGGSVDGLMTSNNVDGVQFSVDVDAVTNAGAGHYNQTTYGIQFWQMCQMHGAGGLVFF